jgi:transcriptional regulator of acetoin/glycerol metabolism
MSELAKFESDISLARSFPVSVLITAAADRALAIAHAIADPRDTGKPRLMMFDGAAILDAANRERWQRAGTEDRADLVIRDIDRLSTTEQAALMTLLDTESQSGRRRIIAASAASLFARVEEGTFIPELFYRLNIIHIVSDPCSEGRGTPSRPIIAA